ncbi:MAG: bifunctional aspartate kinase/homoserine dehydrogenase I, partial [Gammaproteobacteria bacterium]
MLVQKFGGSSLASHAGFRASAELVERFAAAEPVAVVLSAVYGVTDLLIEAIERAENGEDFEALVDEVLAREQAIVDGIADEGHAAAALHELLAERRERLRSRLAGVRLLGDCPDKSRAEILASGENLSSRLM